MIVDIITGILAGTLLAAQIRVEVCGGWCADHNVQGTSSRGHYTSAAAPAYYAPKPHFMPIDKAVAVSEVAAPCECRVCF